MAAPKPKASRALYRYRFGPVEFDESRFELKVHGAAVEIEPRALEVLSYLLRHVGEAVTKQELLREVWVGRITVDKVLPNAIAKLRQALGEDNARAIQSLPRIGYRLTATVERVAVGRHFTSRLNLAPGQSIPRREAYVLRQALGSSSEANEVWLAEHRKTRELRAFKFGGDGERLAALKREATVARLLREALGERPDIVRILDWNFDEPPFFLECEFGGSNLLEWSRAGAPLQEMDLLQRLDLFLRIADAVVAAHSVGVLHKDIKPTNVLMAHGATGWTARLTDFGSAHLLDPERLEALGITRLGMTQDLAEESGSGTLLYLAPEVLAGQPYSTRSDVYSLGLLLYQLVAKDLLKPMSTGWERDIHDDVLREDIAAATDGDPEQRLQTVAELTQRLRSAEQRREQRRQQGEHVARALVAERQLEKARARRPLVWGLFASLSLGLAVASVLYWKASASAAEALLQLRRAESINEFLHKDLLAGADPSAPGSLPDPRLREVLERAATRVDQRFASDARTRALVKLSLGDAYYGLSDYARAAELQAQAVTLLRSIPDDRLHAEALYRRTRSLDIQGRFQEAQQLLDEAAQLRQTSDPALRMLGLWTRGGHWLLQMQPAQALPLIEELEQLRLERAPSDEAWRLRTRQDLAWCYVRLDRAADAARVLEELVDAAYTPQRVGAADWAKMHFTYGMALVALGRHAEAEQVFLGAREQLSAALGGGHYLNALAYNYLATVYEGQGLWAKTLDTQERAYRIFSSSVGERSRAALLALGSMGAAQQGLGRLDRALATLRLASSALDEQFGPADVVAQRVRFSLASATVAAHDCTAAQRLLETVQPAALAATDPGYDWAARIAGIEGQTLLCAGDVERGSAKLEFALERLRAKQSPAWLLVELESALRAAAPSPAPRL